MELDTSVGNASWVFDLCCLSFFKVLIWLSLVAKHTYVRTMLNIVDLTESLGHLLDVLLAITVN